MQAGDSDALIISTSSSAQLAAGMRDADADRFLPRAKVAAELRRTINDLFDQAE